MSTLVVTTHRTLFSPDGIESDASETFRVAQSGYSSVADLQQQARDRWHRDGDTVASVNGGVVRTYARPRYTSVNGWRIITDRDEITLEVAR